MSGSWEAVDEAELVRRTAAGDRRAFDELYRRTSPWLALRLQRRCADEDVVADVLQESRPRSHAAPRILRCNHQRPGSRPHMIGRRTSVESLRAELEAVNARISAHPLASPRIRAAHEIVDAEKRRGSADVDQELAAEGLPSVEELGRAQVSGTLAWWRLHRAKRKLEKAIERGIER